jgi:hypothetical protein
VSADTSCTTKGKARIAAIALVNIAFERMREGLKKMSVQSRKDEVGGELKVKRREMKKVEQLENEFQS